MSPAEPRIAVIVPCFDDGETLEDALATLREQEPCEVVIVNDGSGDAATLATLQDLRSRGVTVVDQANQGLAAARMTGVRATRAPFVYPLDADDGVAPGALTRLADALEARPDAALAWGDQQLFGELSLHARRGDSLDPWLITHVNMLPVSALIRRSDLVAAGGWQLHGGYEDWDLWMALAERGRGGFRVPGPSQLYRVRSDRMLADTFARHDEQFALLRARHDDLFRRRRSAWRRSSAAWHQRLLIPVAAHLPFAGERTRHRAALFLSQPVHGVRSTWRRFAG